MKIAYDINQLNVLAVLQNAKQWAKGGMITKEQFEKISTDFKCNLFFPNIFVRIVLYIASTTALSGATVLISLPFIDSEKMYFFVSVLFGFAAMVFLELMLVKSMHHYKSGVTEALLYYSLGFVVFGLSGLTDFNVFFTSIVCVIIFSFSAIRYLDLLSTVAAILSAAWLLFYTLFEIGGLFKQLIPFAFILFFTSTYFAAKKINNKSQFYIWSNNLLLVKVFSLVFIYCGGNYLVVRELSVELMDLFLEAGQDIPFAIIFYSLTILIPVVYVYFGVKRKNIVLLRAGVIALFCSIFTFKYYYSLGHPEITLTLGGLILIGLAIYFLNYLKTIRGGFTREKLIAEKWADMNAEAILISQTMGGNIRPETPENIEFGGGGGFDGGGAGSKF